ncbi:hypothetical protein FM106_14555 [Brachybacterium faecium]|nr:hypothetical protein FM106_14555 [Brachybacterium faecium]
MSLREQYGTEISTEIEYQSFKKPSTIPLLSSLQIYLLTETIWDGATASTFPSKKRVPFPMLMS